MNDGAEKTGDENTELESPANETNEDETTLNDSDTDESEGDGQEDSEEGKDNEEDSDGEEKVPFHKHPRFQEITKQNKQLQEIVSTLLSNPNVQKILKSDDSKSTDSEQQLKPLERAEVDGMFEGLPEHTFKKGEEYESMEDFYYDFRAALISDMKLLQTREKTQLAETTQSYSKQINEVRLSFGEDTEGYNKFVDFAQKEIEKGTKLSFKELQGLFQEYVYKKENKTQKQSTSKIATKSAKSSGGGFKLPSLKMIRNSSFDDLAELGMKNA